MGFGIIIYIYIRFSQQTDKLEFGELYRTTTKVVIANQ